MTDDRVWPQRLRILREQRRLSRPEVAAAAQVSVEAIKAYEIGRRRPKLATAARLLASLHAREEEIEEISAALGYHAGSIRDGAPRQ